ncbi:hypothetical protein LOD99_9903 [Oopsacas minuta]|uniref:Uncharacterized protein n=1 Tax=Oopsacas minuta TaxID=111878 RepID=A0AAV7KJZ1_9METZ|nr:hypothetical protein LOD99_9903 [Oopsacas minuta]
MSDSDSTTSSLNLLSSSAPLVPTSHLFNPLCFLSPSDSTYKHGIDALRITYNLAISLHTDIDTRLSQLYTEGFDQEQIWQQLELWNVPTCQNLSASVQQLPTADINILPVNGEITSVASSPNHSPVIDNGTADGLKYKDFFQEKSPQKPDTTTQSNYSRVKGKIQARIEELERENMAEKD